MSTRCLVTLMALLTIAGPSFAQTRSAVANPLLGAWRATEILELPRRSDVYEGGSGKVGTSGVGLRLFTARYYSVMLLNNAVAERPSLPDSSPTVDQLLAVWGPVGANSGKYEIRGDTLITEPLVAKNPRAMATDFRGRFIFRVSGDSLWLTGLRVGGTIKHIRLER